MNNVHQPPPPYKKQIHSEKFIYFSLSFRIFKLDEPTKIEEMDNYFDDDDNDDDRR